ncbi:LysM peptidoglycan-binding domain-containing protein [Chlamydiifrater volucris]|uniref:LysM peptidoglycan-binding domain-containing protein n=1 Tax=Chlamydiifrater volucris TaxID=2681470 RepID=UPI001BCEA2B7|nr:LysM peptidoglycan-binding domain-containing protein [Chlamydiifrater volucris]
MSKSGQGKWLSQSLILSIALNVVFLFLLYSAVFRKDIYKLNLFNGPMIARTRSSAVFPDNFIEIMTSLPLGDLFTLLDSEGTVHGRPLKQFALGAAVSFHHFDIVKAVEKPVSMVELEEKGKKILVPEGLKELEYSLAKKFFAEEKYPYTSRGLFILLNQGLQSGNVSEELIVAFCSTPEFLYLRNLLVGAEEKVSSLASLVRMVILGGEEVFFSLCSEKSRATLISDAARRQCLSTYLRAEFPLASLLFLVHDSDYVVHTFPDERLIKFLRILPMSSPYAEKFCCQILSSPRSSEVKVVAQALLSKEDVRKRNVRSGDTLGDSKEYIVKEGDSLWSVAKKFRVSVDALSQANGMKTSKILPGNRLKIPCG